MFEKEIHVKTHLFWVSMLDFGGLCITRLEESTLVKFKGSPVRPWKFTRGPQKGPSDPLPLSSFFRGRHAPKVTVAESPNKNAFNSGLGRYILGGGFKYCYVHLYFGKWSNLTNLCRLKPRTSIILAKIYQTPPQIPRHYHVILHSKINQCSAYRCYESPITAPFPTP